MWDALSYRQGKVQIVDMKMEEVKSRCLPKHVLEQHHAMRQLIYDIAASIDGFIADPDGNADCFLQEGDHMKAYFKRLESYDTVIMGRATYEPGWG